MFSFDLYLFRRKEKSIENNEKDKLQKTEEYHCYS